MINFHKVGIAVGYTILIFLLTENGFADPPRNRLAHLLNLIPETHSIETVERQPAIFLSFADKNAVSPTFGTELCVIEIPKRGGCIKFSEVRAEGHTEEIYEKFVPNDAIGAITGGFFGYSNEGTPIPLGFVKIDGLVKNKKHPWTSGGLLIVGEKGHNIIRVGSFRDITSIENALQSKPLLVEDGKDGIRSNNFDRFDRSAVAMSSDDSLILAVIHEPGGRAASLSEFSYLLLNFRSRNKGHITWALAMDGGPGAHLYIPKINRHCGAQITNYIPNLIYVEKCQKKAGKNAPQ